MPWVPPLQIIEGESRQARLRDRRNFRRDVMLRVLPAIIKDRSLAKNGSPVELAFEVAEACVQLDARYSSEDAK